ncbi:hypothetical protein PAAG_11855 [Paracoccidioides lutzii Pb01]|uniref:Uncharacterized protein n=1 Tax=Paracoccidioides lutzii (strain ATCC MYA-826 / Pb01) TaxID=502779 RepID=A0A0A2V4U9_PARBA|nr:hypothetical protein PAAG_11855 [Paracoccidioides lutzii Pb01]KGQ01392.1 hypothetical protein PAAG_11855 [Paracoccidioides lutzii Pb01]
MPHYHAVGTLLKRPPFLSHVNSDTLSAEIIFLAFPLWSWSTLQAKLSMELMCRAFTTSSGHICSISIFNSAASSSAMSALSRSTAIMKTGGIKSSKIISVHQTYGSTVGYNYAALILIFNDFYRGKDSDFNEKDAWNYLNNISASRGIVME